MNHKPWHELLGLRPREISVLNGAIHSVVEFGIQDFLTNPGKGTQNAAHRLIERGFLTRSPQQLSPPTEWVVVRFTEDNRLKMLADAEVTR